MGEIVQKSCNIAVVVVTRNEERLGAAIRSLCNQTYLPHVVIIMDDGTRKRRGKRAMRASLHALARKGITVLHGKVPGVSGPPALRAHAFHTALDWPVELVVSVDADDELAPEVLANFAAEWRAAQGLIDVFSPSEIMLVHPDKREESYALHIPQRPVGYPQEADARTWVEYTRHGATFAVTSRALQRYGYWFLTSTDADEWVVLFIKWFKGGASFRRMNTSAGQSYRYSQHPPDQQFAARRAEHAATRVQTALALLRA